MKSNETVKPKSMVKSKLRRNILISSTAIVAVTAAAIPFLPRVWSTTPKYDFVGPASDRVPGLEPPVECTGGTVSQSEGPFYSPDTPQRADLRESGTSGETLVIEGFVMTTDCVPIPGAIVDIWHSDEKGSYDNQGYRYRGHQFTDSKGLYRFTTIRPTRYVGRTAHIHVKVQGQSTRLLTTQMYFPDQVESNSRDSIYRDNLVMDLRKDGNNWVGRFDFVVSPV